jgi:hypothetical protein
VTFLSQTKYTPDILKKFGMDKAKPIKTPTGINGHLDLDMGGKSVEQKVYCSVIGVDVSYAVPQAHEIVNVALHREYSLGIVFKFSQGRKDLYHV